MRVWGDRRQVNAIAAGLVERRASGDDAGAIARALVVAAARWSQPSPANDNQIGGRPSDKTPEL